jgi:UTP--glucose-1-phosphate uridylyltransferase
MLGDDIIDSPVPCMKQMIAAFERNEGPVIAVQQVPKTEISAYGVIDATHEPGQDRVYRIRDLVEKPKAEEAPSDLAIIGRYILTPDIFGALETTPRDAGGEIQLTNGLRRLKEARTLFGYRFEGTRHDAGNKLGFLKATVEFALKRQDLGGPFREYLKSLKL